MATTSTRLDRDLIEKATIMARALNRTPPKQIEHWAKIGEITEDNPDLPYKFVKKVIIAEAEREAGELENWRTGELESWRAGELESWRAGELESYDFG